MHWYLSPWCFSARRHTRCRHLVPAFSAPVDRFQELQRLVELIIGRHCTVFFGRNQALQAGKKSTAFSVITLRLERVAAWLWWLTGTLRQNFLIVLLLQPTRLLRNHATFTAFWVDLTKLVLQVPHFGLEDLFLVLLVLQLDDVHNTSVTYRITCSVSHGQNAQTTHQRVITTCLPCSPVAVVYISLVTQTKHTLSGQSFVPHVATLVAHLVINMVLPESRQRRAQSACRHWAGVNTSRGSAAAESQLTIPPQSTSSAPAGSTGQSL
jgi:hypothetical protein